MPRVLYLVTEDWYFCSHRMKLAVRAAREGYDVWVITNDTGQSWKITAQGFHLVRLKLPRSVGSPVKELGVLWRLVRLYRQIRPDIIHHVALKPVISGSVAAWIARMPAVINAYTGLGYLFISDSPASRLFTRVIVPIMARILAAPRFYSIVQNEDDRKILTQLRLIRHERTTLIRGSGVDMTHYRYFPETDSDTPVVLFASRLLRDKGIHEFIDASLLLRNRGVQARFVLAGDIDPDNPSSVTRNMLDKWIADGAIEWWGYSQNMPEVLARAHLVCLPSYREGLPKILLEAAACGRAIITTDVPGCRDAIIDGISGLLVPPRDGNALANAINRLLVEPDLRRQMGEAGHRHARENFTDEIVNSLTVNLYNELLLKRTDAT